MFVSRILGPIELDEVGGVTKHNRRSAPSADTYVASEIHFSYHRTLLTNLLRARVRARRVAS